MASNRLVLAEESLAGPNPPSHHSATETKVVIELSLVPSRSRGRAARPSELDHEPTPHEVWALLERAGLVPGHVVASTTHQLNGGPRTASCCLRVQALRLSHPHHHAHGERATTDPRPAVDLTHATMH